MKFRSRLALFAAISVAGLAVPVLAQATVYCVGTTGGDCDQVSADLPTALTSADGNTGADTVRVGAGTFTGPNSGFGYQGSNDPVAIVGAGAAQTTLTIPASVGGGAILGMTGVPGSSASDLRILIPAPIAGEQYRGVSLGNQPADFARIRVEALSVFNGFGLLMDGGGSLVDSTVELPNDGVPPTNTGLQAYSGIDVTGTRITADTAINFSGTGQKLTLQRSRLESGVGLYLQGGDAEVTSTLIEATSLGVSVGNPNGFSAADTFDAQLDGVTITGGDPGVVGVDVFGNPDPPTPADADSNSATIRNSILDVDVPLRRRADEGARAEIRSAHSSFDPAGNVSDSDSDNDTFANGLGSIASLGGDVNVAPGFVDAGTGDYHFAAGSPLIDAGDPTAPAPGSLDLDGSPRALDGDLDCFAVRDIGALEFVPGGPADCVAPETQITGGPSGPTSDNTPTFTFSADEPATFECRVDAQAFGACSAPASHTPASPLADGAHVFQVRATDTSPAQNTDPTPASRSFTVDTAAPNTTATVKAKVKTKKKSARVRFTLSSEPGASFECSLDGAAFAPCSSPFGTLLKKGRHTLQVAARDVAGNLDASPASASVKVVKKKRKKH